MVDDSHARSVHTSLVSVSRRWFSARTSFQLVSKFSCDRTSAALRRIGWHQYPILPDFVLFFFFWHITNFASHTPSYMHPLHIVQISITKLYRVSSWPNCAFNQFKGPSSELNDWFTFSCYYFCFKAKQFVWNCFGIWEAYKYRDAIMELAQNNAWKTRITSTMRRNSRMNALLSDSMSIMNLVKRKHLIRMRASSTIFTADEFGDGVNLASASKGIDADNCRKANMDLINRLIRTTIEEQMATEKFFSIYNSQVSMKFTQILTREIKDRIKQERYERCVCVFIDLLGNWEKILIDWAHNFQISHCLSGVNCRKATASPQLRDDVLFGPENRQFHNVSIWRGHISHHRTRGDGLQRLTFLHSQMMSRQAYI